MQSTVAFFFVLLVLAFVSVVVVVDVDKKSADVEAVVEAAAVVDERVGGWGRDKQASSSQDGVNGCEYKMVYVDDGFDWVC